VGYLLLCVALLTGIALVSLDLSSMHFPKVGFRRSRLVLGLLCRLGVCFQVITEICDGLSNIGVEVFETESKSLLASAQCCVPCLPLQPRANRWPVGSLRLEIVCEILQVKGYKYGDHAKRVYMWHISRTCNLYVSNKTFIKIKETTVTLVVTWRQEINARRYNTLTVLGIACFRTDDDVADT